MITAFKTEQGKKEILELYDEKLSQLKIKFDYQIVNTEYGKTNIIICGNQGKPPMLLVHGSNGCAPIAIETYQNLLKEYKIYSVDVIAQPNKSEGIKMSMKDNSYGKWITELINKLKLDYVTMAGFSLGGLVILKTLEYDESKINEVFLSSPAYIVNGNPLKALFKVFIPMKRYMKTKKIKYVEKFLAEVFTERDDFAVKYLSKVFLHFKMDFTPVPIIKKENAQSITTPITLFAGKNDILFPGEKMIKRAKKIFPSLKKSELLINSKHVQNKKQNGYIENFIIKK